MAKRAIILDVSGQTVRVVLWADVPAARQAKYANAASSIWTGASAAENTALQNGSVAEKVVTVATDGGAAQIKTTIQALWQYWQNDVSNINPWQYQGTYWDGTAWTTTGVA